MEVCAILYSMKREIIEQARIAILQHIAEKGIQEGNTIPSIRQLQAVLLISKNATLEALQGLCSEGVLEKGSGARNGYLLRRLPDELSSAAPNRVLTAQFMLPLNTWNYVGNQFLVYTENEFSAHKGQLLLSNTGNDVAVENRLLRTLLTTPAASRPNILLLMPALSEDPNLELLRLLQQEMPVMLIDRQIQELCCHSVSVNHHFIGADAVERLWNRGHRRFAFAACFSTISPIQERLSGYLDALRRHDCRPEASHIFLDPNLDTESYHMIHRQIEALGDAILQLSPRPTGIVCGSDRIATCLVNHFLDRGLSIPDDIAVIGCDGDTEFSDFCRIPLCSYRQPFLPMARYIYRTANDILSGTALDCFHVSFQPEYIDGKTI